MRAILTFLVLYAGIYCVLNWLTPRDDSDQDGWFGRSGLSIHKDALTGCEYVGRMFGGATPRLDATGKQICRK